MNRSTVLVLSASVLIGAGWVGAVQSPASSASAPQAQTQSPLFEVAAIKPSEPGPRNDCFMRGQPGGQTFIGRCINLRLLIKYSYKITDSQIAGGPDWLDSELYDFDAKANRPVTRSELAPMFQKLLADRFKLEMRRETRTLPALVLTVDKGGLKMARNESSYEWEIPVTNIPGPLPKVKGSRCPMSYLAWWIGQRENRPVVDHTDLAGFWDFTLEFVPDSMAEGRRGPNGESLPPPEGATLPVALREQLGLKLASERGPVDVYVIEHVEKVTAN